MLERTIEEKLFIPRLVDEGYKYNTEIKTYPQLEDNFWMHMERLHGKLSVNERKQISEKMMLNFKHKEMRACVKNAFKIMYVEDGFEITKDDGKKLHISFIDTKNSSNNIYEVINQLRLDDNRGVTSILDTVLLVNGIPRSWGELKSSSCSIDSALNDIINYHDHALYGLMCYVNVVFVSNDVYTRYNVNDQIIKKETFKKWKDECNVDVNEICDFATRFFKPSIFEDILLNCIFVKYGKIKELNYSDPTLNIFKSTFGDKKSANIILKGYQYRAYKASIDSIVNKKCNAVNWLHMGTGKTFISIMTFMALKRRGLQVILLIDRQQLTKQTIENFAAFDPYLAGTLENTETNYNRLCSGKSFITTIQSFNAMLTNEEKYPDASESIIKVRFRNNIVFLQDEVHRTQGRMRTEIERKFPSSKWCGFTGTPLLTKEQIHSHQKLTLDLFKISKFTYEYKMENALEDGETLKLRIEEPAIQVSRTFDEELEEIALMNSKDIELIEDFESEDEDDTFNLKGKWRAFFTNEKRMGAIVKNILVALPKKCEINPLTGKLRYIAQLMVSDVNCVNLYANMFDKIQKELGTNYKIVPIGAVGKTTNYMDPNDHNKVITKPEIEKYWIERFNEMFKLEGKYALKPTEYDKYENKVIKYAEQGEVDIIISATKLTTGYDNPLENTIFMDRMFNLQALLQAVARASRVLTGKLFANIVCYIPLKNTFDRALYLYNRNSDLSDHVIWRPYAEMELEFIESVKKFLNIVESSKHLASIESSLTEDEKKDIIKKFFKVFEIYKIMQSYIEYNFDEIKFGITEEEIKRFKTIINSWKKETSPDVSDGLEGLDFTIIDDNFYIEIDVSYIRKLIASLFTFEEKEEREKRAKEIIEQINASKNPIVIAQKPILLRSIEEALKCTNLEEYEEKIIEIIESMKESDILDFITKNDLDIDDFKELIEESLKYGNERAISKFVDKALISKSSMTGLYKIKIKLKNNIKAFLEEYARRYNSCY